MHISIILDLYKLKLNDTLLITDTILRVETTNPTILSDDQIEQYCQLGEMQWTTKRGRFLKAIYDILLKKYDDRTQLMYLFPFAKYPFPVILNKRIGAEMPKLAHYQFHPYNLNHLRPNYFKNCTVIVTLMTKDKTYGDSIRGFALINKRLLEKLGFRVLLLKQRDYPQFIMPTDKVKPDSEEYREETNKLLNTIKVVL